MPRVSLATSADKATGKCYLYTAYDYSDFVGDLFFPRIYAKMKVWDITQEGIDGPTPLRSYGSASDLYSWHSTVTTSAFSHNVGWFAYRRQIDGEGQLKPGDQAPVEEGIGDGLLVCREAGRRME